MITGAMPALLSGDQQLIDLGFAQEILGAFMRVSGKDLTIFYISPVDHGRCTSLKFFEINVPVFNTFYRKRILYDNCRRSKRKKPSLGLSQSQGRPIQKGQFDESRCHLGRPRVQ